MVFSHYQYFDKVLDLANKDWINHQREAWVWMRDRWVPYPFQNNIQRLPEEDLSKCVKGLVKKNKIDKPKNFKEWLENGKNQVGRTCSNELVPVVDQSSSHAFVYSI